MTKESNIMAGNDLQADATAVAEFMGRICEGWEAFAEHNPLIEIRCIGAARNVTVARFALDWLDEAVEHAIRMNEAKQNIYMCVNPIDGFAKIESGKGKVLAPSFLTASVF